MGILLLGFMTSCLSGPLSDGYFPSPVFLQPTEDKRFIEIVTIQNLLQAPGQYHQKRIRVRGIVTRLELHLDDSKHFINFVFHLKTESDRVLVFGRHDRTQGDIQMTTGRSVEVEGIFWKEREANGHRLLNNVEAQRVRFYPSLIPDEAAHPSTRLSFNLLTTFRTEN